MNIIKEKIPYSYQATQVCTKWDEVLKSKKNNYINAVINYLKAEQDHANETTLINCFGEDIDIITIEVRSLQCAIICINSPFNIIERIDGSFQIEKIDNISIDLKNQCELLSQELIQGIDFETLNYEEKLGYINRFFDIIYNNFNSIFQLDNPISCTYHEDINPYPSRLIGGFIRMKNEITQESLGFDKRAIDNIVKFIAKNILYPLGINTTYPGTRERKLKGLLSKKKSSTNLSRFFSWPFSLLTDSGKKETEVYDPLGLIRLELGNEPTWSHTILEELQNLNIENQGIYSLINEFWDKEKNKPKIQIQELLKLIDNILNDVDIDSTEFIVRTNIELVNKGINIIPELIVTLKGWYKYFLVNDSNSICEKLDFNSSNSDNNKTKNFDTPVLEFQVKSNSPPLMVKSDNKKKFTRNKRNSKKAYNKRRFAQAKGITSPWKTIKKKIN